jgi:hypothetical protein
MPGLTPLRPDDVHSARAWAAFVADDAAAAAPSSLEARVLRAAQAALMEKQRADAERARRRWFAGISAIAASLLAAAAWSLAPGRSIAPRALESPSTLESSRTPESPAASSAQAADDAPPGRPVPMTNIEAGRVLGTPLPRLASRPLFDPSDGAGLVQAPGAVRMRSFGATVAEPVAVAKTHGAPNAPASASEAPAGPGALAGSAPEAWSLRAKPVFDPDAVETAPALPVYRLDHATPVPAPREDPPAPPK